MAIPGMNLRRIVIIGAAALLAIIVFFVLCRSGDSEAALARESTENLSRAADGDKSCVEAWKRLGEALLLGAEAEKAVDVSRHAATLSPKDAAIHLDLGQALLQTKQFGEAEKEYRAAAALVPDNPY